MNKVKALQKENSTLEKELDKVYSDDYSNMIVYMRGTKINGFHQEEIRNDLINLLLEGQKRGESLEDVFGQDKQAFIDDVIASAPTMTATENFLSQLSLVLTLILNFSFIFIFGDLLTFFLEHLVKHNQVPLRMTITWLDLISMLVIIGVSIAIVKMIIKGTYILSDKVMRRRFIFYCLLIFILIFSLLFLNQSINSNILEGPIWYYLPLCGLLALAKFAVSYYYDKTYNRPL
ncbi:hypothetical protein [Streptococcus catagoni]|uniref:hypothetical protein n=1 Tax=Streptococcus catagoni TaxID=2654874 RepID=UPI001409402F|nr:hypothetical protein [Streptococcus catagoni]